MTGRVYGLPAVKEIDSRLAALDVKIGAHGVAMATAASQHDEAVDQWEARVLAEFEDGSISDEQKPSRPETLRLAGDHAARLRHERDLLVRERQEAIASGAVEVLESVSAAVAEAIEKARPLLTKLDPLLAVLTSARADLSIVTDAVNATSSVGTMSSPDVRPINLLTLAEAVQHGSDPLAPDKAHTGRVLGMQIETTRADGSKVRSATPRDDPEKARIRDAALTAQRLGLQGNRGSLPLGYRGGDRLPPHG